MKGWMMVWKIGSVNPKMDENRRGALSDVQWKPWMCGAEKISQGCPKHAKKWKKVF